MIEYQSINFVFFSVVLPLIWCTTFASTYCSTRHCAHKQCQQKGKFVCLDANKAASASASVKRKESYSITFSGSVRLINEMSIFSVIVNIFSSWIKPIIITTTKFMNCDRNTHTEYGWITIDLLVQHFHSYTNISIDFCSCAPRTMRSIMASTALLLDCDKVKKPICAIKRRLVVCWQVISRSDFGSWYTQSALRVFSSWNPFWEAENLMAEVQNRMKIECRSIEKCFREY